MSSESTLTFRCRISLTKKFLSALFFGAVAAALGHEAATNTEGVLINHVIELGPSGATIFYWVLSSISGLLALGAIWTIFTTLRHGIPDVVVTDDAISFPYGFLIQRSLRLPFAEITELGRFDIDKERLLVFHTAKEKYSFVLNWLKSNDGELQLQQALTQRVPELFNIHP